MKHLSFLLIASLSIFMLSDLHSQEQLSYQTPSDEIMKLADVQPAPSTIMDSKKEKMVFLYRNSYKSIQELSNEEMRLAGLRIDPKTNIGSRTRYVNDLKFRDLSSSDDKIIGFQGMPSNPRLSNFSWSPDQSKMAMTYTSAEGVELWYIDFKSLTAKKLTEANVNANLGDVITWFKDGKSILVKMLPKKSKGLIDTQESIPTGPTISVSDGKKAQNRTYQDLLKNKNDEANFETLATSVLVKVNLDGTSQRWLDQSKMYQNISMSPNGEYVMVKTVEKPFSYLVTYRRFPSVTNVYSKDGKFIKEILSAPLVEDLPQGFMSTVKFPRSHTWRADRPASLIYAEALDGGDPSLEVDFRDQVYQWDAPFSDKPKALLRTINRYRFIQWGDDNTAIAYDYWWNTRNTKTYLFNPSNSELTAKVVHDRNYQDRYSDPGSFVTVRNKYNLSVLSKKGNELFLTGDGFTKEGQKPFIDSWSINSEKSERLYESVTPGKIETIYDYDAEKNQALVRIESASEYPNYYFRNLESGKATQLTDFENPFSSIQNVHKEVITYKREDGLELNGTLYLPVGYDKEKKEKMPMILWAYPREFKDKSSAGQNTQNPNEFTYPYWGSPLYWVAKGYVVLDDAAFPIVGEGDEQPNDSFLEQLVANAKAAIDAIDNLGYIDRERVAVGGHSYGAFMVANLLSHSDLFAAGIARSGAYNRTLTPFGFQSEERNYWEAPEVYYTMSPFMHADKMKTPLLLIHGEADNNSGTYPLQSERYFNALKGLGAPVRLVMLPKESHGYAAKESIMHMLWEQDEWLDMHVKNNKTSINP